MTRQPTNLGASVTARLLNQAKLRGTDYQVLLTSYCLERFLYRLGSSAVRDRFVLKGALLLRVWSDQPYRATRDLDLLGRGDGSSEAVRGDLLTVLSTLVEPDGVMFDGTSLGLHAIRAEDEYAGTRATLMARCGTARLTLQVDIGIGDSVWPPPQPCVFPALLDFPAPEVLAYPREAVVAEKLEALIVLGDRNSRIKDFFDLHYLANHFAFDRATLGESVRRAMTRRGTPVPAETPIGLTPAYWGNPTRPAQMRAFARRAGVESPAVDAEAISTVLSQFLIPILGDLSRGEPREGHWPPGGPWHEHPAADPA
jgi:hypothetical protein